MKKIIIITSVVVLCFFGILLGIRACYFAFNTKSSTKASIKDPDLVVESDAPNYEAIKKLVESLPEELPLSEKKFGGNLIIHYPSGRHYERGNSVMYYEIGKYKEIIFSYSTRVINSTNKTDIIKALDTPAFDDVAFLSFAKKSTDGITVTSYLDETIGGMEFTRFEGEITCYGELADGRTSWSAPVYGYCFYANNYPCVLFGIYSGGDENENYMDLFNRVDQMIYAMEVFS